MRTIDGKQSLEESLREMTERGQKLLNKTENPEKQRVGVGMPATLWLNEFGSQVWAAFGEIPYLVGSALTGKNWRDVDVRVLLSDSEYAAMFGDPESCHQNGKWCAHCMAFSLLGRQMTGLPIDFQIQQVSQANKLYPLEQGHERSALGLIELRMAKRPTFEDRIKDAFPEIAPSGGHDPLEELIGLLRVTRSQRDSAETQWQKAAGK